MHRIHLLVLALPTFLIACGGSSIDAMRSGMPNSQTVQLQFPNQPGQHLDSGGQQQQAQLGATAGFYVVTRGVTVLVNVSTALILGLVKAITDNPPTSFHGNVAVWGPWTDALSPNTYRLTVFDNGNYHYSYALEGKAKQDPDTAYVTILSGSHTAAVDSSGQPLQVRSVNLIDSGSLKAKVSPGAASGAILHIRVLLPSGVQSNEVAATVP